MFKEATDKMKERSIEVKRQEKESQTKGEEEANMIRRQGSKEGTAFLEFE
jgi:hypothetical protein